MANNQTTTTTTVKPTTTTTTVDENKEAKREQEARANDVQAAKDEAINGADTKVSKTTHRLKEQSAEKRLADARQTALDNHAAEHANDDESYDSVISRDKVRG